MQKESFSRWIAEQRLLQIEPKHPSSALSAVMFGRLIQYQEDKNLLIIYLDDEKKVCNLSLDEIETIKAASQ